MDDINENETFAAIADALPWIIRAVLLTLRDDEQQCEWDKIDALLAILPDSVYSMLFELCLVDFKDKEKHPGKNIRLTAAGKHLADYCTC